VKREGIVERILKLKEKKNAIILAHNYQTGDVQDIADFVGDSLDLSIKASKVEEDVIVFCGVHFMAETAVILSPEKTILIPDANAGCPMADMITAEELRAWKKGNPGSDVVCYVNTSAAVKAECDICCTSANAKNVVASLKGDKVLFAPDKNLSAYIARGSKKKIIPWDGYCYVHNNILPKHVREKKKRYPEAEVWVHPECLPEVIDLADRVFSTGGMVKEARKTALGEVIIGTEAGMIYRLAKENPGKRFYPVKDNAICSNMKKITLEKVLISMENMEPKVEVSADIRRRAKGAIEKMVSL
jgi:quinolinate synthase